MGFKGKRKEPEEEKKKLKAERPKIRRTGNRLYVEDFMIEDPITVNLEMSVSEIITLLLEEGISGAPVTTNHGKVLSVVSHKDLMIYAAAGGMKDKLKKFIPKLVPSNKLICVTRKDTFTTVFKMFLKNPVRRIIVRDSTGTLQGLITRTHILQAFLDSLEAEELDGTEENSD